MTVENGGDELQIAPPCSINSDAVSSAIRLGRCLASTSRKCCFVGNRTRSVLRILSIDRYNVVELEARSPSNRAPPFFFLLLSFCGKPSLAVKKSVGRLLLRHQLISVAASAVKEGSILMRYDL
jgi:hypothetical protein